MTHLDITLLIFSNVDLLDMLLFVVYSLQSKQLNIFSLSFPLFLFFYQQKSSLFISRKVTSDLFPLFFFLL